MRNSITLIVILLISHHCIAISNTFEKHLINNIVKNIFIDKSSEKGFIVITNINSCLTCNLSNLNTIFNEVVKTSNYEIVPRLIVEVESLKDSYFIKNEFKNILVDEDTSNYYTKKFNSNYILIYKSDNQIKYIKLNDLQDYYKSKVNNYIFGVEKFIKYSRQVEEHDNFLLNTFNIVDVDKYGFKLFDTKNYALSTFNFDGKNLKNDKVYRKYQFIRGGKEILDSLIHNDFAYFEAATKMIYCQQNNNYYILYHMCLDSLFYQNGELNISISPLIACFDVNFNLKSTKYLPLDNYCDFLIDSNKVDLLMSNFPNMMNDSNSIIISSKNLYNSDFYTSLNKFSIDTLLNIELNNFDYCDDFLLDSLYKFIFTFAKYKKIVFWDDRLQEISLDGRVLINSDFKIVSSLVKKDMYYLILSDDNNFYLQTYNLKSRMFENEQKFKKDEDILESVLLDCMESQLILLNKRKKTRWSIDFY